MSHHDATTVRRLSLRDAKNPAHRFQVLLFARRHATGAAQRALLALIGEAAA
ncbi:hypothetical protein [Spirulina subsalsa]|uniref:hypothetical protein n=1 Tax=Spirulina subsalsa TaxID=54311 RepID=UPI002238321C|nr:hypothetical protein [Spirulina subsalsa]